jgi:hypothetical protein
MTKNYLCEWAIDTHRQVIARSSKPITLMYVKLYFNLKDHEWMSETKFSYAQCQFDLKKPLIFGTKQHKENWSKPRIGISKGFNILKKIVAKF